MNETQVHNEQIHPDASKQASYYPVERKSDESGDISNRSQVCRPRVSVTFPRCRAPAAAVQYADNANSDDGW